MACCTYMCHFTDFSFALGLAYISVSCLFLVVYYFYYDVHILNAENMQKHNYTPADEINMHILWNIMS